MFLMLALIAAIPRGSDALRQAQWPLLWWTSVCLLALLSEKGCVRRIHSFHAEETLSNYNFLVIHEGSIEKIMSSVRMI